VEGCATHPTRRENPQRHKPPPARARDNTEHIREISVRRAIGAKAKHIFTQILVESTVVGIICGILGLIAHHVRRSLHCPHILSAGVLRVQLRPSAARRRQTHLRPTPMRPESPNHALQRL
jgi:hypothetical protein